MLKLLLLIIVILLIPPTCAEVSNLHISPENPHPGDTITISGTASPNEQINAIVSYTKTLTPSERKYKYRIDGIKIPKGPNRFIVRAQDVENLNVRVRMLIWWTKSVDASGGIATVSQSNMLPGTYEAQIDGISAADTSAVVLKVTGERTIDADSSGNFKYSYDTDALPAGDFELSVNGLVRTLTLHASGSDENGGITNVNSNGDITSDEAFENILISETKKKYVVKDSKSSYLFDFKGNVIRYINFSGLINLGMTDVKVEILKHTSTQIDHSPSDIIYKNLNICVGEHNQATNKNIADLSVNFKVEKSWIIDNNIEESTIRLNRYDNGMWNMLQTITMGEDADYLYYEAQTPGFSQFAITGQAVAQGTEQPTIPVAGDEGMIKQTEEGLIEQTEEEENKAFPSRGIPGFVTGSGVIGLLIAVFVIWKKS